MEQKIYVRLFYLGAILAFFAASDFARAKFLLSKGVKVNAKVVKVHQIETDDGYTYKSQFQYTNQNGIASSFLNPISSNPPSHIVGEQVELLIDPENEQKIRVKSYWGLYRWTLILLLIALPLLIFGGGFVLYESRFNPYQHSQIT